MFGVASVPVVLDDATLSPAPCRAPNPATGSSARPVVSAEAFYDALVAAGRAAMAEYGERWKIVGETVPLDVPARLRHFAGPAGGRVNILRDQRAMDLRNITMEVAA